MEIKIDVPVSSIQGKSEDTFTHVRHYLKQLEIAVKHAQKSLDTVEDLFPDSVAVYANIRFKGYDLFDVDGVEGNPDNLFIEIQNEVNEVIEED